MLKNFDELYRSKIPSEDFYLQIHKGIVPLQIELHPGTYCLGYDCPHCYGHGRRAIQSGRQLILDDYLIILDSMTKYLSAMDITVDISGITSDPMSFAQIDGLITAIKKRGFTCGMHTKGYQMSESLMDALISDMGEPETFISLSLDAWNEQQYNRLHGLREDSGFFFDVIDNLKKLHARRKEKDSKLRINVGYLLFEENSSNEDIKRFIELVSNYCDSIKISLPQPRNDGKRSETFIRRSAQERLDEIRRIFHRPPQVFVGNWPEKRPSFDYCFAQYYQVVVDAWGNLFPCPQTAEKTRLSLSYGNILRAPIEKLLASRWFDQKTAIPVFQMGCQRVCDRKDLEFNSLLGKYFEKHKNKK